MGDVNGDGFADVIATDYAYDNGETDEGGASVYYGSASGLSATADWVAEGNQTSGRYGFAASSAGDVNGDGFGDVIASAAWYDGAFTSGGKAWVYHGSPAAPSTASFWTTESNQSSAELGYSVATAGDVNGDGYADIVVGARKYDNSETDEGKAFVFHGSATGPQATEDWSVESNQDSALLASSVATAGDVNGDGYADLIVGAANDAYVFHGSATGLAATAAWTASSGQAGSSFGTSVASAGDVNGDGYVDVIVGAYTYDNGETDEGRAYVYLGSAAGLAASPAWVTESDQSTAYFGYSVAGAGDVNGDGYSDVIVGAYQHDGGLTDEGRAFVYYGSATGLATTPAWTVDSDTANAHFGVSVAGAGDVNGDGFSDAIVGARKYNTWDGRAYVYYGSAGGLSTAPDWQQSPALTGHFGISVATAGDVNGDGYADVIVGAKNEYNGETSEGLARVYLGSVTGLSTSAGWTGEENLSFAYYGTPWRPPVTSTETGSQISSLARTARVICSTKGARISILETATATPATFRSSCEATMETRCSRSGLLARALACRSSRAAPRGARASSCSGRSSRLAPPST
ncbi:MAG: FG-GAP repeat protein [Candidatus Schekmanbacteria bacterium]|nr:FG-GAP repeat protein [Candidatus Schekmanbacteria bacterium]